MKFSYRLFILYYEVASQRCSASVVKTLKKTAQVFWKNSSFLVMFQGLELYQKLTPLQFFFNDFYLVTGAEKLYCKTNFGTVYVAWITFH